MICLFLSQRRGTQVPRSAGFGSGPDDRLIMLLILQPLVSQIHESVSAAVKGVLLNIGEGSDGCAQPPMAGTNTHTLDAPADYVPGTAIVSPCPAGCRHQYLLPVVSLFGKKMQAIE